MHSNVINGNIVGFCFFFLFLCIFTVHFVFATYPEINYGYASIYSHRIIIIK